MNTFHKANATRFKPWLCLTTMPLFAFSCVSLSAQQPPWEGCRTASKIEYESAKRDFCRKPVSARTQRLGTGGDVTIGIVIYSDGEESPRGLLSSTVRVWSWPSPSSM